MDAELKITLEEFPSEDEANSVGHFVLEVTKVLSENFDLNISKLKVILVSYNFHTALVKVVTSYNHQMPASFTKSKQATAVGQLVSKINAEGYSDEYTLVLSVDFFDELYDENLKFNLNEEGVKSVMHRLHHELVHVHEKNTLTCLDPSYKVNEYGCTLLIPATRVWSEYLANVKSSNTLTSAILESFTNNLERVLREVPNEIEGLIESFKKGEISLDVMFQDVRVRVNLIINSFGYAIGYIHGLDIKLSEYSPVLYGVLEETKLKDSLSLLDKELALFLSNYEAKKINGYDDFLKLSEAIGSVYRALGLKLECENFNSNGNLSVYVE